MFGEQLAHGGVVGVGDIAATGFAGLTVGGTDGFATSAGNRTKTDLAKREEADVFFELALNADRVVRDGWFLAQQQGFDAGNKLITIDWTARDGKIYRDDGVDRTGVVCFVPVCLITINDLANFF